MEIGLDYMQIRSRAEHYGLRWAGIALLLVGLGLALAGGSYYGYHFWPRLWLDEYKTQRLDVDVVPIGETAAQPADADDNRVRQLALPPGVYDERVVADGFTPLASADGAAPGVLPAAANLKVNDLGIRVVVGSDRVVQRGDANPGERGALWIDGRTAGKNNSINNLSRAPDLMEHQDLPIIVKSGEQEYLYLATHTDVIPESEWDPAGAGRSDRATVHLVVLVPRVDDHYLVLSGELVGVR